MEWMLQVVDEIDDAIGALRLCTLGLCADVGLTLAAGLGMGAIGYRPNRNDRRGEA